MTVSTTHDARPWDNFVDWLSSAGTFFKGWAAQPDAVASVIPSSRKLNQQLYQLPPLEQASTVVELGPGTGGTTTALLRALNPDANLLAIEVVADFARKLQSIQDDRLVVHQGDAVQLSSVLQQYELACPDVIVSGIPFSTMQPAAARSLVADIYRNLAPGGLFAAYQVRDRVSEYADDWFGQPQVSYVLWNIPPLRLYQWRKPATAK